jgi:hypothetical protein
MGNLFDHPYSWVAYTASICAFDTSECSTQLLACARVAAAATARSLLASSPGARPNGLTVDVDLLPLPVAVHDG